MDNVPSSAILAIVAIVAACLLGAFIFTTVQSQKEAGNGAVTKTEQMNSSLDESTYTQYDGATVTGTQVLAAAKALKGTEIVIIVKVTDSVFDTFDEQDAKGYSTTLASAKKKGSPNYITPSAKFTGSIQRNPDNGAIMSITFERQQAATSPKK